MVSEQFQISLLLKMQRLLSDGAFTASYKFALLQALIDLAVERGNDSDAALRIPIADIGEKFLFYYWRQVLPYIRTGQSDHEEGWALVASGAAPGYGPILHQITQENSVILKSVRDAHTRHGGSLAAARSDQRAWRQLVAHISRTVREMPLWKLQTVGDSVDEFLYANQPGQAVDHIELFPGVAFTLRRFHGFIQELVRGGWLRFVRGLKANRQLLGDGEDLYEFLFGCERTALLPYVDILRDVQSDACFYCERRLGPVDAGHVDHFVPWTRYPFDLAHNFVLAHARCNESKANLLASIEHLQHWMRRNAEGNALLVERFTARRMVHDLDASRAIVAWAYDVAAQSGSKVWRSASERAVDLDPAWRAAVGLQA